MNGVFLIYNNKKHTRKPVEGRMDGGRRRRRVGWRKDERKDRRMETKEKKKEVGHSQDESEE